MDVEAPTLAPLRSNRSSDRLRQRRTARRYNALARALRRASRREGLPAAARRARMHAANPRYVLRNYLAQQAIDRAEQGDDRVNPRPARRVAPPYDDQPGRETFAPAAPGLGAASGRLFDAVLQLLKRRCRTKCGCFSPTESVDRSVDKSAIRLPQTCRRRLAQNRLIFRQLPLCGAETSSYRRSQDVDMNPSDS